jgi:hypothetical protein
MKLRSIRVKQLQPETNRIQVQGKVPKIYNFDPDVVHNRGTYHYFIRHCVRTHITGTPYVWNYEVFDRKTDKDYVYKK